MDLTFNIIFVPGTVRYLRLAILSLLQYSSYRYRLVANGLDAAELSLLEQFCRSHDRLELYAYPTKSTLAHGTLLTVLQQRERGEYFCFMDSDIFAASDFQLELERHLIGCDIFSSCAHLGLDPAEQLVGFEGRCLQAPNGLPLATTFLCVYRNEALRRIITETGAGFERYSFPQHFSPRIQRHLHRLNLHANCEYDTGKLLSVLAHSHSLVVRYEPLLGLIHIGGIAKYIMKNSWRRAWKHKVRRLMQRPFVLRDADLEPQQRSLPRLWTRQARNVPNLHDPSLRAARRAKLLRRHVALYFAAFFRALFDGEPEPVLAISDPDLRRRIESLCIVIRGLLDGAPQFNAPPRRGTGVTPVLQPKTLAS